MGNNECRSKCQANSLENDYARFWIKDGILYNEQKIPIRVDKTIMADLIKLRTNISNGQNQYWCMDGRNIKSVDEEAMNYAEKHGQENLNCTAVLVNSHLTKFMFNTYLKLNKPKFPMRIFNSKEEAVKWLLEIKVKRENL